ncbi:MAG TPA: sortase [Acidimicrobiales bacterium]|nr:sortase [Acidimicrobiales bacterium]
MTTLLTSASRSRTQSPAPAGGGGRGRKSLLARLSGSRFARFGLPALAVLCALAAAVALAFPTLSDWYAHHEQQVLAGQLDDPAVGAQAGTGNGAPIGRISIPSIGVDMVVVQGTDEGDLAKGPGHYPASPMPCAVGDVAIAGHRTTFLHPFYNLNELVPGDAVVLETRQVTCRYVVSSEPFAVSPHDVAVVANTPGQYTLTLTTCTPRGSARQRLVVKATMVSSAPRGPAATR